MGVIVGESVKPFINKRPMRAERILKAAIAIARERQRICFEEADRYKAKGDERAAGTENSPPDLVGKALEAVHLARRLHEIRVAH